jgi:hypothetical protein
MSGGDRKLTPGLVPALIAALALRRTGLVPRRNGDGPGKGQSPGGGGGPGYETRDVNTRNTVLVMAGLAATAAAVIGGMVLLRNGISAQQRAALPALTPQQTQRLLPPPPNLQPEPYVDLDRQRAAARAALEGYGYLDPGRTRAHIPIDRAMQLSIGRSLDDGRAAR